MRQSVIPLDWWPGGGRLG